MKGIIIQRVFPSGLTFGIREFFDQRGRLTNTEYFSWDRKNPEKTLKAIDSAEFFAEKPAGM